MSEEFADKIIEAREEQVKAVKESGLKPTYKPRYFFDERGATLPNLLETVVIFFLLILLFPFFVAFWFCRRNIFK